MRSFLDPTIFSLKFQPPPAQTSGQFKFFTILGFHFVHYYICHAEPSGKFQDESISFIYQRSMLGLEMGNEQKISDDLGKLEKRKQMKIKRL